MRIIPFKLPTTTLAQIPIGSTFIWFDILYMKCTHHFNKPLFEDLIPVIDLESGEILKAEGTTIVTPINAEIKVLTCE